MTNRFNALCGQEESDHKFLVEIIAQICDYVVDKDETKIIGIARDIIQRGEY